MEFPGDIEDISDAVVTPEQRGLAAKDNRPPIQILAPRARTITAQITVDDETKKLDEWSTKAALDSLVGANNSSAERSATFEWSQADGAFYVEPAAARDAQGNIRPVTPILSTPITVPELQRSAAVTLQLILNQVSANSGYHVGLGTAPLRLLGASQVKVGGVDLTARQLLTALLREISSSAGLSVTPTLSYRLLYDPKLKHYMLNISQFYPSFGRRDDSSEFPGPPSPEPARRAVWYEEVKP